MTHSAVLLSVATLILGLAAAVPGRAAAVSAAAPLFEAESSAGPIRLADFFGKKNVLLAFYFKDFTAG